MNSCSAPCNVTGEKFSKFNIWSVAAVWGFVFLALAGLVLCGCAGADVAGARHVSIPSPTSAQQRPEAVNEKPDSVLYLPLGSDVLVPEAVSHSPLPDEQVGPFELRGETLAGALQLILAEYEIPLAFETEEGLSRTITVAGLKGPLDRVVERVCGLADLYCAFEDGLLIIKETQTFTVTVPPIGGETNDFLSSLSTGIEAITGASPIVEQSTRTLIYEATSRTARLANRYFQRIRANTALIVYEIYIWEVSLTSVNDMGINWSRLQEIGKFNTGISIPGSVSETTDSFVSIGLPTTGTVDLSAGEVLRFISDYGAVETISQPQITMLSGSESNLRAARTENYISSLARTIEGDETTVSTETDSVDTGFDITIESNWDNSTIYTNITLALQEVIDFQQFFTTGDDFLELPITTDRELTTQVRIRPGDSLILAGLVRENDDMDSRGPGFEEPVIPTSRRTEAVSSELVILLKPRVVVFTAEDTSDPSQAALAVGPAAGGSGYQQTDLSTIPLDILNPAR